MATTFGPQREIINQVPPDATKMYPSSSRDKLNQLNTKAREMLTNQDLHYDPDLFRDEAEAPDMQIGVGESQLEDVGDETVPQLDPAQTEQVKMGDIVSKPLPSSLKTARFQQEVIQSLSGPNPGQQNKQDGGSARLAASGYQPNFNFADGSEQYQAPQQQ